MANQLDLLAGQHLMPNNKHSSQFQALGNQIPFGQGEWPVDDDHSTAHRKDGVPPVTTNTINQQISHKNQTEIQMHLGCC